MLDLTDYGNRLIIYYSDTGRGESIYTVGKYGFPPLNRGHL